jgi:anthranilate synthase/aminodeoxychorismate synthase-like glutamine amidotransferase
MINFIDNFSALYKHGMSVVLFVILNFQMNLLLLDNHDSFTWNLVEMLRQTSKVNVNILMPEQLKIKELEQYDKIIFSPGPGLPQEHPVMFDILGEIGRLGRENLKLIHLFGVCLGMQAIAIYFGGTLYNLPMVIHGQPKKLNLLQSDHFIFRGIPDDCEVGLYHSWAVDRVTFPTCLEALAIDHGGIIMALAHKTLPVCGVQFHPESIMTPAGHQIILNWLTH